MGKRSVIDEKTHQIAIGEFLGRLILAPDLVQNVSPIQSGMY